MKLRIAQLGSEARQRHFNSRKFAARKKESQTAIAMERVFPNLYCRDSITASWDKSAG